MLVCWHWCLLALADVKLLDVCVAAGHGSVTYSSWAPDCPCVVLGTFQSEDDAAHVRNCMFQRMLIR